MSTNGPPARRGRAQSAAASSARRRKIVFGLATLAVMALAVGSFIYFAPVPVDGSPSWSPDGKQLTFYSDRDGNSEIYTMDADGTHVKRLTNDPASDGYPQFSPDGDKITFDSDRSGNYEIWVMDANGENPRQLTNHPARDVSASWSPDGSKIAFMSDRAGQFDIWTVNAEDGTHLTRLTNPDPEVEAENTTNWFPMWSPDGARLAFHVGRDVHVLTLADETLKRLTVDPQSSMYPSWSPDGKQIAFMSWREGPTSIYVMDDTGFGQHRIAHAAYGDLIDPRWSPDGLSVAFAHVPLGMRTGGPQQIYVLSARDGKVRRLSRRWYSWRGLLHIFSSPLIADAP